MDPVLPFCHLDDTSFNFVDLPSYHFISNHRKHNTGGGTGLYLQDHYEYKLLSDCTISDPDTLESVFVEINNPSGKNIIIGTVYRPPNQNVPEFFDKFFVILSIISKDNKRFIMGDFNLDALNYDQHAPTQEFMVCLFSHVLFPIVTRPTWITAHSATLIDNIFTNQFTQNIFNGIIVNDISDHLPVLAFFKK